MTDETAASPPPRIDSDAPEKRRHLSPLLGMLPFLREEKLRILAALLALVGAAIATLAVPMAVRRVVDFGFSAEKRGLIDAYFGMIVALTAALAITSALRFYFVMTVGERVVARIRSAVFSAVMRLDGAFYDKARSGEIVSRLTADTALLKSAFGASASIALRNLILLIGAIGLMIATSPGLSVLVLLAIPAIVLPLVAAGRGVRARSRYAQDRLADAASFATERIGAVRVVQSFAGEGQAIARFSDAVEDAYRAARAQTLWRACLTAVIIFLVFASITFVLWTGAKAVIAGEMSAGRLSQFVLYAVFAASSLSQLSEVYGELSQAAGAAERLSELLGVKPLVTESANPRPFPARAKGTIRMEALDFAYPGAPERLVLKGIDITIKAGERVAIVGPSGGGKTSLFQLILRHYDPVSGKIAFDDAPIRDLALSDLRAQIALVPQDPVIFSGTISENIRFARPDASDEEVEDAARKAAVLAFTERLPQGLLTSIGERGVTLSGGERQRIAIARAILRDAPILLLDEATSALDAENERHVQEALVAAMTGRTVIVIAHRLATIRDADRILVLDQGRIIEEGTHAQLTQQDGVYARLAQLQFS